MAQVVGEGLGRVRGDAAVTELGTPRGQNAMQLRRGGALQSGLRGSRPRRYAGRSDIAGMSLMRQTLVAKRPHRQQEIVNDHEPFLYRLVRRRNARGGAVVARGT